MAISITCAFCGTELKDLDNSVNRAAKCPQCGRPVATRPSSPATATPVRNAPATQQEAPRGGPEAATVVPVPAAPAAVGATVALEEAGEAEPYAFLAPPQGPDEMGRLGPYRVLKVLGSGGMGVVFQAEDPRLQRLVALKVINPILAANATVRQRFQREARATAAIEHDHIVTIHEVGEDRGIPFLAMQFLQGETLEDRLRREPKLSVSETLRIGRQIASGLAAAHQRGLIHRDVKPANIFLATIPATAGDHEGHDDTSAQRGEPAPPDRVKIVDFGLVGAAGGDSHLTRPGGLMGTPAYMAPEQIDGQVLDCRCDLFALGCVLYRMGTGEAPFTGPDTVSTLMAVSSHHPPAPRDRNPQVPLALSRLIMQLLAKNPAQRPPSARAVIAALNGIGKDGSVDTDPDYRLWSGGNPPSAADRRRAGLMATIVLLSVVLAGLILLRLALAPGWLVIDTENPDLEVVVRHRGEVVLPASTERTFQLKPGHYDLALVDTNAHGARLAKHHILITPGGRVNVPVLPAADGWSDGAPSAADLAAAEPSPADRLNGKAIASALRWSGQPEELVAVLSHGASVQAAAFSSDGQLIASGGSDRLIRLWDAGTGKLRSTLPEGTSAISGLAFVPEEQALVSGGVDGTLNIWNLATQMLWTDKPRQPAQAIRAVAVAADGRLVAVATATTGHWSDRGQVKLWELPSHKERNLKPTVGHLGRTNAVAIALDSQTLASGGADGTIKLWDVAAGKEHKTYKKAHKGAITGLAFAPNGRSLASAGQDGVVKLWNLATGKDVVLRGPAQTPITALAYAPAGAALFWADDHGSVVWWDWRIAQKVREWQMPGAIHGLAPAPDGRHLATAGENGSVYVLRYRTRPSS
jgi:serine/threonine protein kinase/WD40 repeat protein